VGTDLLERGARHWKGFLVGTKRGRGLRAKERKERRRQCSATKNGRSLRGGLKTAGAE